MRDLYLKINKLLVVIVENLKVTTFTFFKNI